MNFRRSKRGSAEVNAGALSDILFFLMLFFIIISTLAAASAIKVQLPNSKTSKNTPPRHAINISVNDKLEYFIDKRQIDKAALSQELQMEAGKLENPAVVLRVDKSVTAQTMIDIMDIANQLKIPIVVAAKKDAEPMPGH